MLFCLLYVWSCDKHTPPKNTPAKHTHARKKHPNTQHQNTHNNPTTNLDDLGLEAALHVRAVQRLGDQAVQALVRHLPRAADAERALVEAVDELFCVFVFLWVVCVFLGVVLGVSVSSVVVQARSPQQKNAHTD